MVLANMRDLLRQADAQKRAVGAFNVSTIEMMCGVVKAAEELQTPVILQVAANSPGYDAAAAAGARHV